MDAIRLIEATRHALAEARDVPDIVAEAWQAQSLAEAVGSHLSVHGAAVLRGAAAALSEAGSRACGALPRSAQRIGAARAAGLSGITDPPGALRALRRLLDEVGVALVAVACSAEEEPVYWQCADGVDAADDSKDRVADLLKLVGDDRDDRDDDRDDREGEVAAPDKESGG